METKWNGLIVLIFAVAGCINLSNVKKDRTQLGTLQTIGPNVQLNDKLVVGNRSVYNGDRIVTGRNTSAYIYFAQGGFVQLDENTDPEFKEIFKGTKCFIRMIGQLIGISYYESEKQKCVFRFRNEFADAVPHGTKVNFKVTDEYTVITVLEGSMELSYPSHFSIEKGWQVGISRKGISWIRRLSADALNATTEWRKKFKDPLPFEGANGGSVQRPLIPSVPPLPLPTHQPPIQSPVPQSTQPPVQPPVYQQIFVGPKGPRGIP